MKKVGNMKLYSFEELLDEDYGKVGTRKSGADSGFRGGDCHAENGVLMVAIATKLTRKIFIV